MNLLEAIAAAFGGLKVHLGRALLSMLGIVCGVASVVAVVAVSDGAQKQSLAQLQLLGAKNIIVQGDSLKPDDIDAIRRKKINRLRSPGLSVENAIKIAADVGNIERVAPLYYLNGLSVKRGTKSAVFPVVGATPDLLDVNNMALARGRFFLPADIDGALKVCVLEDDVRRELAPEIEANPASASSEPADLGSALIDNDVYRVIGILQTRSAGNEKFEEIDTRALNRRIYIPITTARQRLTVNPLSDPAHDIVFKAKDADLLTDTARRIRAHYLSIHKMEPIAPEKRDFRVTIPRDLIALRRAGQRLFENVMGLSAGISLLVGGIGIMNIMLANVNERRREIGIRRAVGARRGDILRQFLVESLLICLIGGLLGCVAGMIATRFVAGWTGWETSISVNAMLIAIGVSLFDGLLFGSWPAWKAAQLEPVEALRYE